MGLKLFYDLMSQPSRTLYIFLKLNKIPFESCPVALRKGEHLSEDFKEKYSKFGKVPFIHDNDFRLSESIAIIRYLCKRYNISDPWYPLDIQKRARVDEYCEWQHHNTRLHCALFFLKTYVKPMMTGKEPRQEEVKMLLENLKNTLDQVETLWLANGQKYIAGDEITIADVFATTEIEQTRMAGFDPKEGRPILTAWLDRVKSKCEPFYTEAHVVVDKLATKSKL